MTSGEHTEQDNNTKRAGRRQRGGEGGEERKKIHVQQRGLNCWVGREGRSPGMGGDRQGPTHRMAVGLDESTERNPDRWRCSVVVRACKEEGTTRKKARRKKENPAAPQADGTEKDVWLGPRDGPRGQGQHGRRHRSEGRGRERSDLC